jgi:hypothetical protein
MSIGDLEYEEKSDGEDFGVKASAWWKRLGAGAKALIIVACVALGLAAAYGLFVLFGNIVMWLLNWIMPYLFQLPTIDFWMAWGIVALSMILFGRASGSGSSDSGKSKKRKKKIKASMVRLEEERSGDMGQ